MCHGDGFYLAGWLQEADMREARTQANLKAWNAFNGAFGLSAGHDSFYRSVPAPEIRAAQYANT